MFVIHIPIDNLRERTELIRVVVRSAGDWSIDIGFLFFFLVVHPINSQSSSAGGRLFFQVLTAGDKAERIGSFQKKNSPACYIAAWRSLTLG